MLDTACIWDMIVVVVVVVVDQSKCCSSSLSSSIESGTVGTDDVLALRKYSKST